jgi:hypothetical protein
MTQRSLRLGVALAGAGHSGSTLLGLVLGSHSRCFYAGEAKKSRFLGDPEKPLRKRACKICGEACPLWARFRPEPDVYEALARLSGREVIVDSTKDVSWIRSQQAMLDALSVPQRLVFLTRDGRAVVNSRLRKDPSRDPAAVVDAWARQVRATQALVRERSDAALVVAYEELATEPERVVRRVCEHIGLAFEPDMLRYETKPHHPLGGNTGTQSLVARPLGAERDVPDRSRAFYEPLRGGFHLDLRWREELPSEALAVFEARAGELNEPYRWDGEP